MIIWSCDVTSQQNIYLHKTYKHQTWNRRCQTWSRNVTWQISNVLSALPQHLSSRSLVWWGLHMTGSCQLSHIMTLFSHGHMRSNCRLKALLYLLSRQIKSMEWPLNFQRSGLREKVSRLSSHYHLIRRSHFNNKFR